METLKVLVIDDEKDMCRGVERALRKHQFEIPDLDTTVGFQVKSAYTAEEGQKFILNSDQPVDLILLDHKLPDKTGLQILSEIKPEQHDFLVIMITAYASLETAVEATKKGAHDFMAKPFTPREIRASVQKAARHLLLQRRARQLAEEKRQARFQFASVLAHELKRPIAAVDGYLQVMKHRAQGDDIKAYDKFIERSIYRLQGMQKLINDLLDMTAIESGQKQRELETLDIVSIVESIKDGFIPEAEKRNIKITAELPESLQFTADAGEIEIILNNLISNAVKYNRDNGTVDIKVKGSGNQLKIEVADTGIGMTEEESARLFQDFVRIKNEKTRDIEGSGLGLSTVRKLATIYHGDVQINSEPDKGTKITVTLQSQEAEGGKVRAEGGKVRAEG
ncbi:MAG: ATP-binding protein [Verrucomicrobiota bacterium]